MKRAIVKRLLRHRLELLVAKKRLYGGGTPPDAIVARQVSRFNEVWRTCFETIPFYRRWRDVHRLPESISCPEDLDAFPELTKADLQAHEELAFQGPGIKGAVSTGGSTGQPTRFPFHPEQAHEEYATLFTGRSWWGVEPLDRTVLIWGHTHLFGTGLRRPLNVLKRRALDWMIETHRLDAYDTRPASLQHHVDVLRRVRPRVVIGYTSCLYKLAKFIEERGLDPGTTGRLKAVILTTETVTDADLELVSRVFGAPAVVEYGMAETSVLAYSRGRPDDLQVLWDHVLARVDGSSVLSVTTLLDRPFPLVNYRTEDIVHVSEQHERSVLRLGRIQGRSRDILRVKTTGGDVLELANIYMVHVLKTHPRILGIQFEQLEDGVLRLSVAGSGPLDLDDVKAHFVREMHADAKPVDPASVHFVEVREIPKSMAGKEQLMRPAD